MNLSLIKLLVASTVILIISACNPAMLKYQLDPEISQLNQLAGNAKIVALKVIDSRKDSSLNNTDEKMIAGPVEEAKQLQRKLIDLLKENGYKIISKPLLADIAFEIEITNLELTIESSTFKSIIRGKSELKLTANRHSQQWSKIYRATRQQEVANPANDLDATGVVNQMLTKQFSTMFIDESLQAFLAK